MGERRQGPIRPRRRGLLVGAALCALLGVVAAAAGAGRSAAPGVVTYPDSQTIPRSGKLPAGAGHSVALDEPIGGDGTGIVVVSGARTVTASVDTHALAPLQVQLRFWHFVRFGSSLVPDALLPWDGTARAAEQQNQPLSVEVSVPYGTKPGRYAGSVTVTADGHAVALPLSVTVYRVTLPRPGQVDGSLLSAFNVGPQSYIKKVIGLYHVTSSDQIRAVDASLYAFLSAYRLSPGSWGYGTPTSSSGYASSTAWWKDTAGNMISQLQAGQFPNLALPLSNNRAASGHFIAGVDPFKPESWCGYLQAVRTFWTEHGFLAGGALPYAYTYDEPGDTHIGLIARQASALHRCFPGARLLTTANPDSANAHLHDGKGTDDVGIWGIVDWRYYGIFTNPAKQKYGLREHQYLKEIEQARSYGARIFAYTYYGVPGFPSFRVTEPLTDPRMFVLWTALEGIDGILYAEGLTTYGTANPLTSVEKGGESVLIYPGATAPIPSARLEQIRDGIEDWEVFSIVRRRFGAARVREILGSHGLFSADKSGVELACVVGCELKGPRAQAWPRWSHDSSTPARIEAARRDALRLASG
jgi:hypothetical protein